METTAPVVQEQESTELKIEDSKPDTEDIKNDYVDVLDKLSNEVAVEKEPQKISEIKKLIEQYAEKYFKKAAVMSEYAGGGGTNAVQYVNGGTMNGNLNVTGNYLSGGVNLLNIFSGGGGGGGNQTLAFNESNADLSISGGNTVSLSSLNGGVGDPAVNTLVRANSGSWDSVYTTVSSNSASWLKQGTVQTYLSTSNVLLSSCSVSNNLTVSGGATFNGANKLLTLNNDFGGNYYQLRYSNLGNEIWRLGPAYDTSDNFLFYSSFTNTNLLNINAANGMLLINDSNIGEKINMYNTSTGYSIGVESSNFKFVMGSGTNDYITFNKGPYDTSAEVVRIQADGKTGIGTDAPAEKLSVVGNISASGTITVLNGDSNRWNSVYTTTSANSARWSQAYTNLVSNSAAYLSGVDISLIATTSGSWNSVYTTTNANSANWQTGYNNAIYTVNGTANQIVATPAGSNTGNNSVTLSLPSNLIVPNNLTVQGNLTALGSSTFKNTIFTTTSALSVYNTGPGPALYVYQGAGPYDVASFYDGDGVEVLHVGNANPGGRGFVGINESFPGAELTVNGAISSNRTITVLGGNSNQWNSNYTTTNTNSANWGSAYTTTNSNSAAWSNWQSVSGNYALGSQYVKLSGDNMTGALTIAGNISSNGTLFTTSITSRGIDLIHIPANDGTNPILRLGEYDTASGNQGFSGVFMSYNENTNTFGISAEFDPAPGIPAISIDRSANVGIGTDAPAAKLTVNGNLSATAGIVCAPSTFTSADTVTDAALIMDFTRGASTGGMYVRRSNGQQRSIFNYQDSAGNIDVGTFSTNINSVSIKAGGGNLTGYVNMGTFTTNNAMRIIDNGNVGIGTTVPNQKLTVIGSISASNATYTSLAVLSSTNTTGGLAPVYLRISNNSGDGNNNGGSITIDQGTTTYGRIRSYYDPALLGWRMSIGAGLTPSIYMVNTTGNVGIGTAAAGATLTVAGSLSASNVVTFNNSTANSTLQISGYANRGGTGYHDFMSVTNTYGSATTPSKFFRMNSAGGLEIINSTYQSQILALSETGNLSISGAYQVQGNQAVNGPAFAAYAAGILQTIPTDVQTKVLFQTEEYDTNNNYSAGSSTFTPTVAGYYQLNAEVRLDGSSGTGEMMIILYKNGSEYKRGTNQKGTQIASDFWAMTVSSMAYANGSTDYFEIYVQHGAGANRTVTAVNAAAITWFNGCMVRGA